MDETTLVTVADDPGLLHEIERLAGECQPAYVLAGRLPYAFPDAGTDWPQLYEFRPEYQFALRDPGGVAVAAGNSLPLACGHPPGGLPTRGWDWCVRTGVEDFHRGTPPDALAALFICVAPAARGRGLGERAITAMRTLAARHGLARVVAPVRPSLKKHYPLTPIAEYVGWEAGPGEPFDPWVRSHLRAGGRLAGPCPESMTFTGRVADWEAWTGLRFPASGRFVAPELLDPVVIDRERDEGVYVEGNYWVVHQVGATDAR